MIDWQRIWHDDDAGRRFSPIRVILFLLSLPYRLIVFLRNRLYDRQILKSVSVSRPVISIGNLTVGGTGKTPCVILLAKTLKRRGYRPAVISRGYGSLAPLPVNVVSDGHSILLDARAAGDEPLLLARSLPGVPVITGAKTASSRPGGHRSIRRRCSDLRRRLSAPRSSSRHRPRFAGRTKTAGKRPPAAAGRTSRARLEPRTGRLPDSDAHGRGASDR
jgi:hypothetical protein